MKNRLSRSTLHFALAAVALIAPATTSVSVAALTFDDVIARLEAGSREMRADEACAPGDEDACHEVILHPPQGHDVLWSFLKQYLGTFAACF